MQESNSIIVQAADGHVKALARIYDVSLPRMYEILGKDNPYPKAVRLALAIGEVNPSGLILVRDDFTMRCNHSTTNLPGITLAELNDELQDVPQAILHGRSLADRKRQITEAIEALYLELNALYREESKR